ncbi:hypothetical protein IAR55_007199 [Kwoniella newhampshirensis]|uniref:Uncharacterized protein n=1 Tax=Kwoniella newhampshirensis TaxID=1651941 RepID=A0AAW0YT11_9TREE
MTEIKQKEMTLTIVLSSPLLPALQDVDAVSPLLDMSFDDLVLALEKVDFNGFATPPETAPVTPPKLSPAPIATSIPLWSTKSSAGNCRTPPFEPDLLTPLRMPGSARSRRVRKAYLDVKRRYRSMAKDHYAPQTKFGLRPLLLVETTLAMKRRDRFHHRHGSLRRPTGTLPLPLIDDKVMKAAPNGKK